ncbi:HUWE1-associated protein modifying stress responses-like [Vanacampus margaritifer]
MYKESMEARQRSYDLGIQIGYQRRNKEMMAWVKKRRRTIRREDLISFLCGKNPPPRASWAPPRGAVVAASRPPPPEKGSSMETDLQPFREAIALHAETKAKQAYKKGPSAHIDSPQPSRPTRALAQPRPSSTDTTESRHDEDGDDDDGGDDDRGHHGRVQPSHGYLLGY